GMLPLPIPVGGGSIRELRKFLNVATAADFRLVGAFLLVAMRPQGPKLGLAVSGEQGSAKSTLLSVLRRLLDPNTAETRSLPKELRTLMISAYNSAMLSFDNVSCLDERTADALCRIMTGAAHSERTNYTDLDETLIAVTRPVMLNGIPDLATRGD